MRSLLLLQPHMRPSPDTVIVVTLFVMVLLVVVGGAVITLWGSEPVHDYLQNVSITAAGFGIGAGGRGALQRRGNGQ